jgi:diguanylate cyclase (GGDEF)-like protein
VNGFQLDAQTLLIASALVTTLTGVLFIVDSFSRSEDAVGRRWAIAFIAAIVSLIAFIAVDATGSLWWGVPLGNAFSVFGVGMVWSGIRRFNDRSGATWAIVLVAAAVAVAAAIDVPNRGWWGGGGAFMGAMCLFALLGGVEALRGRMRRFRNAYFLAAILLLGAAMHGVRLVFFIALGPESEVFTTFLGTAVSTLVTMIFIAGAAMSMIALRGEESRHTFSEHGMDGLSGALTPWMYGRIADPVLQIASRVRRPLCVVVADIDELATFNAAFGRSYGDAVLVRFAEVLVERMPAGTPVCRLENNRFAMLVVGEGAPGGVTLCEQVRRELLENPLVADELGVRVTASYGVASAADVGYSSEALLAAASSALAAAKADGRNGVAAFEPSAES